MNEKRTVLITGASRGIGRAIAEECARDGHNLILISKDSDRLGVAAQEIQKQYSCQVHKYACDISDQQGMADVASDLHAKDIFVDVLILNAGIFIEGDLLSAPVEDFEETLKVDFLSSYHLIRLFRGDLLRKPSKIIVIASTAAHEAYPVGALYGVAKWALRGLCVNLRKEFADQSVSVNVISPGGTLTDLWEGEILPPKRLLEPRDIGILASTIIRLSEQAVVEQLIVRPILGDMHD